MSTSAKCGFWKMHPLGWLSVFGVRELFAAERKAQRYNKLNYNKKY